MREKETPVRCPYCGGGDVAANGTRENGARKYACRSEGCGRFFDEWTGTVFSSCKLPSRTIDLVLRMVISDCLLEQICEVAGVTTRTAYVWRMKIYAVASAFLAGRKLSGRVWIDEKFVPVNASARAGSGKRKLRGISGDQVCICCGIDSMGERFAEVAGRGHPRSATCERIYSKHIEKGSLIVHDDYGSHARFVASNGGKERLCPSWAKSSLRSMQPINSFCAQIERKFVVHVGMLNEYAQLYLDWCVFETLIEGMEMEEKIAFVIGANRQSNAVFRVKDRYHR